MSLSDPFNTTYQGSMQAGESLGQGIQSAAGSVADVVKQRNQQMQTKKLLQTLGIGQQIGALKDVPVDPKDWNSQVESMAKSKGISLTATGDDATKMNRYQTLLKAVGIPFPSTTKKVLDVDAMHNAITSGVKTKLSFDEKGNLRPSFETVDPESQQIKEQNLQLRKEMDQESQDKFKDKRVTDLGSELDPSKFRQGVFGQEAQTFDRGEALQSLMNQADKQPGGADTRQIVEAAIGLQNMLSRGNSSVTEVMQLVPQSMQGNANKITEWLTNNPTGLDQQAFTDRLKGTIQRELDTSNDQMNRVKYRRLAKYEDVKDKYPDDWDRVLRSNGVNPDDYEQWKKSGYKKMSAVQGGENSASSTLKAASMSPQQSKYTLVQ